MLKKPDDDEIFGGDSDDEDDDPTYKDYDFWLVNEYKFQFKL